MLNSWCKVKVNQILIKKEIEVSLIK